MSGKPEEIAKPEEKSRLEQAIKDRLYRSIAEMYRYVADYGIPKWLGYTAGIGFKVEGIGEDEPSLQKMLSLLHLKKEVVSATEYLQLILVASQALRNFNYQLDVKLGFQQEFLESKSLDIIKFVATQLEEAAQEAQEMME